MHSRYFVKFDQGPELEVDDGIIATDGHRISRIYLSSPESRGEYYAGLYNHSMGTSDLHLKAFADAIGLIAPGRPGQGYLWTAAIPELAASMMTTFTGQPMYVVVGSFITGGWLLGLVLFWDRPRSRRYASARQAFDAQSAQLTALLDQQLSEARV